MAPGAMEAACERRLLLPGNLSIIGFDNNPVGISMHVRSQRYASLYSLLEAPTLPSLICPGKLPEEEQSIFLGQAV